MKLFSKLTESLSLNGVHATQGVASTPPSHDAELPRGDTNENPAGIGLLALLAEDFRTYDASLTQPGFWAVAAHRFGNARMDVKSKVLRAPLTLVYDAMFLGINWAWGIDLPYVVKLGRRVRIWHHGGMVFGARAIGDDVHIRHNTTFGIMERSADTKKPIIGNRVDIGAGAAILGAVTVGDDCVIGANSVVLRDLPAGSTVLGVPARPVNLKPTEVPRPAGIDPAAPGRAPT
ncbi:MAG: serine acetyltransferase [Bacteroidota bacterium]